MIRVTVEVDQCHFSDNKELRLIPNFGLVTEQVIGKSPITPKSPKHCPERFSLMATFQMTDSQQVIVTLTATDKRNQPVPLPTGTVVATTDNSAVLTATVNPDNTITFAAVGILGTSTGSVTVNDASGNPLASGSIDFTIVSGAPTNLVLTPGTPSEQP